MGNTENLLHGHIVAKFGSIAKFAKACDISYARAYRIITGAQTRTEDDMRLIVKALGLKDAADIVSLFSLS